MVFRLVELTKNSSGTFCATEERLVAKECKYEEDLNIETFHEIFCKTQRQASKLAYKFNAFVSKRCSRYGIAVPAVITFLSCSVMEVPNIFGDDFRTVLVEKRLDPSKYMKWNSNNGYVAGPQRLVDVLNRQLYEPLIHHSLGALEEGDENEELSDDEHEHVLEEMSERLSTIEEQKYCILPEHFPQAFSHHTYRYTKRKQLVCDLQGVLDTSVVPAVFELTDPVIHSNYTHNPQAFGKTDHGHKGMRTFMNSHICNDLCKLLGFVM